MHLPHSEPKIVPISKQKAIRCDDDDRSHATNHIIIEVFRCHMDQFCKLFVSHRIIETNETFPSLFLFSSRFDVVAVQTTLRCSMVC